MCAHTDREKHLYFPILSSFQYPDYGLTKVSSYMRGRLIIIIIVIIVLVVIVVIVIIVIIIYLYSALQILCSMRFTKITHTITLSH